MKTKMYSNIYAGAGFFALALGAYASHQVLNYWEHFRNLTETIVFSFVPILLFLSAGAHLITAVGYRYGRLQAVRGTPDSATLERISGVIVEGVQISLILRPNPGDHQDTSQNQRFVFLIANRRPWICPEHTFLIK